MGRWEDDGGADLAEAGDALGLVFFVLCGLLEGRDRLDEARDREERVALVCDLAERPMVGHEVVCGRLHRESSMGLHAHLHYSQRMKQAFVRTWLLSVSVPMIRLRTCMIVIAVVWSLCEA